MQVNLMIICAKSSISLMDQRLTEFYSRIGVISHKVETQSAYWKNEQCLVINVNIHCPVIKIADFERELVRICGKEQVQRIDDGVSIEFSCYASIPEILSGQNISFVMCFITY